MHNTFSIFFKWKRLGCAQFFTMRNNNKIICQNITNCNIQNTDSLNRNEDEEEGTPCILCMAWVNEWHLTLNVNT